MINDGNKFSFKPNQIKLAKILINNIVHLQTRFHGISYLFFYFVRRYILFYLLKLPNQHETSLQTTILHILNVYLWKHAACSGTRAPIKRSKKNKYPNYCVIVGGISFPLFHSILCDTFLYKFLFWIFAAACLFYINAILKSSAYKERLRAEKKKFDMPNESEKKANKWEFKKMLNKLKLKQMYYIWMDISYIL